MSSLTSWPVQENGQSGSLDDLFQGYGLGNSNNLDFSFLTSPASISPVAHHITPAGMAQPLSLSSSPSSSSTDPLYTPKDSPPHQDFDTVGHDPKECPKTKAELVKCIEKSGPSPFAPSCTPGTPGVRKSVDGALGAMITCEGNSSFPKTQKNAQNVEVLSAWRSITSNPKFKVRLPGRICEKGH
jgi:AP-1-like factor